MISPEWAAAITGIVVGVVSGGISGGAMLIKMGRGQGAAKVRNDQIDQTLGEIKTTQTTMDLKIDKVMNGESKCRLSFLEEFNQKNEELAVIRGILGITKEGAELHGHARADDPPRREIAK